MSNSRTRNPIWLERLTEAEQYLLVAHQEKALALLQSILADFPEDAAANVGCGTVLLNAGLLSAASECFRRALLLQPNDPRILVNQATALYQAGNIANCRNAYMRLLRDFPDDRRIWRNALLAQEYDLAADDAARFALACQWAERFFGQPLLSSSPPRNRHKKLRIGYLSPDLNRHPVGLLLLPVIRAHDRARFDFYVYCNNAKEDEVSERLPRSRTGAPSINSVMLRWPTVSTRMASTSSSTWPATPRAAGSKSLPPDRRRCNSPGWATLRRPALRPSMPS